MIHYIIAAGIGAFLGSQSKKSKKSYAEGGEVKDKYAVGVRLFTEDEDEDDDSIGYGYIHIYAGSPKEALAEAKRLSQSDEYVNIMEDTTMPTWYGWDEEYSWEINDDDDENPYLQMAKGGSTYAEGGYLYQESDDRDAEFTFQDKKEANEFIKEHNRDFETNYKSIDDFNKGEEYRKITKSYAEGGLTDKNFMIQGYSIDFERNYDDGGFSSSSIDYDGYEEIDDNGDIVYDVKDVYKDALAEYNKISEKMSYEGRDVDYVELTALGAFRDTKEFGFTIMKSKGKRSFSGKRSSEFAKGGEIKRSKGSSGRYHILSELKGQRPSLYVSTNDKKSISKLVKKAEKDLKVLTNEKHNIFVTDSVEDREIYNFAKGGKPKPPYDNRGNTLEDMVRSAENAHRKAIKAEQAGVISTTQLHKKQATVEYWRKKRNNWYASRPIK